VIRGWRATRSCSPHGVLGGGRAICRADAVGSLYKQPPTCCSGLGSRRHPRHARALGDLIIDQEDNITCSATSLKIRPARTKIAPAISICRGGLRKARDYAFASRIADPGVRRGIDQLIDRSSTQFHPSGHVGGANCLRAPRISRILLFASEYRVNIVATHPNRDPPKLSAIYHAHSTTIVARVCVPWRHPRFHSCGGGQILLPLVEQGERLSIGIRRAGANHTHSSLPASDRSVPGAPEAIRHSEVGPRKNRLQGGGWWAGCLNTSHTYGGNWLKIAR